MTGIVVTERLRRAAAEVAWSVRDLLACASTCPVAASPVGLGLPLWEASGLGQAVSTAGYRGLGLE